MNTEKAEHFAKELEWVARRLREGRAGEAEIETLVNTISTIRTDTPPTGTEEEIAQRYIAAKQAETLAAGEIGTHFWPLVKAATTEAEARAILRRVPGGAVETAFFMDHFIYVSKVIPKAAPAARTEEQVVTRYESAKKAEAEAAAEIEEFFVPLFREAEANGQGADVMARVPTAIRSRSFFQNYVQERLEGMSK